MDSDGGLKKAVDRDGVLNEAVDAENVVREAGRASERPRTGTYIWLKPPTMLFPTFLFYLTMLLFTIVSFFPTEICANYKKVS